MILLVIAQQSRNTNYTMAPGISIHLHPSWPDLQRQKSAATSICFVCCQVCWPAGHCPPPTQTQADALTALTALLERDSGQGMTGSRGMLRGCHQLSTSKPNTRFQHEVGGHQVSNWFQLAVRKNMEKTTVQFSKNLTVSNALCMYHALGDSMVKLIPNLCMLPPVLRTTFSMRPPKEIICKGTNPFPSSWLWHAQARKYEHVWKASGHIMSAIYEGLYIVLKQPTKRS